MILIKNDNIELINKELNYLKGVTEKSIAIISMTAKKSFGLRVLPRRKGWDFNAISFLVTNIKEAKDCLLAVDGKVDFIFIDIEEKQNINLITEARRSIKLSKVITCKPNDVTIESCDLFIRKYYSDEIENKTVLIIGSGNLSTKLALRLAERQAQVHIFARNFAKTQILATSLNLILPQYIKHPIQAIRDISQQKNQYDIIISFLSAEGVIGDEYLPLLKVNSLIIDGGINNYKSLFIKNAIDIGATCYRLDVRIAYIYSLLLLSPEIENFFTNIIGKRFYQNYNLVSGGVIGNLGDIIVDKINGPTQVIGIADGSGGVKNKFLYTEDEENRIQEIMKDV